MLWRRILLAALVVLGALYLLQVNSPLRLNTDAIVLLSMADSFLQGTGFLFYGKTTMFPPGYPALVALATVANLGASWGLILMNCLFLAAGVGATYFILTRSMKIRPETALLTCCLTMLCYVFVKHVTLPLTDIPFFGLACVCLMVIAIADTKSGSEQSRWLLLAWVLTVASIFMRRTGLALVPVLFWVWARQGRDTAVLFQPAWWRERLTPAAVLVLLVTAGITGAVVAKTSTSSDAKLFYSERTLVRGVAEVIGYRLTEWGEVTSNVPQAKLPAPAQPLVPAIGMAVMALAAAGYWMRRRTIGAADIYVVSYSMLVAAFPFYDARYWIPAFPFVIGHLVLLGEPLFRRPTLRLAAAAYVVLFATLGLVGLGYSTRVSFAGDRFPDVYGDGSLTPTYRAALLGDAANAPSVIPEALAVLQKHGPRSRGQQAD